MSKGRSPEGLPGFPLREGDRDMSSLFVDPNKKFHVTVKYYEKDGATTVLKDGEKEPEEVSSLTITCREPDFQAAQVIIHSATIFTEEAIPVVDMLRVRKALLYHLAVSWNAKDDDGKPVPLGPDTISSLHPAIAAAACGQIEQKMNNPIGMFLA